MWPVIVAVCVVFGTFVTVKAYGGNLLGCKGTTAAPKKNEEKDEAAAVAAPPPPIKKPDGDESGERNAKLAASNFGTKAVGYTGPQPSASVVPTTGDLTNADDNGDEAAESDTDTPPKSVVHAPPPAVVHQVPVSDVRESDGDTDEGGDGAEDEEEKDGEGESDGDTDGDEGGDSDNQGSAAEVTGQHLDPMGLQAASVNSDGVDADDVLKTSRPPSQTTSHHSGLAKSESDQEDVDDNNDNVNPNATALVLANESIRVTASDVGADDSDLSGDSLPPSPLPVSTATSLPENTLITWFNEWSKTHFDGFALNNSALESESWALSNAWEDQNRFGALLKAHDLSQTTTTPECLQVVYLASCANSPQAKTAGLNILGGSVYGISDTPMTGDQFRLTLWSLYSLVKDMEARDIEQAIYASQGSFGAQQYEQHRHNMLLCALAVKADVENLFGKDRMVTIGGWAHSQPADVERDLSILEARFDMPGHLVVGRRSIHINEGFD